MAQIDISGPPAIENSSHRGRGTRGWRFELSKRREHQELVIIDAGCPFGGEWPDRQVWHILDGRGWLSWEASFGRVRVTQRDSYCFEACERRLIIADTAMLVLITSLE